MASGNYEYQSDFARRYVAQGKAEGKVEGRTEGEAAGRAHAILAVLAARRVDVPDDLRRRIGACTDVAQLDAWLVRAATAATAADLAGA
jgi:predicted transposase YdaD